MSTVERAIRVAAEAHRGQTTRLGEPYVLHPLRVMLRVVGDAERQVAALHDVVERTDWSVERLREEGFSEEVLAAVVALTRREGEDYLDAVRRAAADVLARPVKEADLLDNAEQVRRGSPTDSDRERLARYEAALRLLEEDGGAGNGRRDGPSLVASPAPTGIASSPAMRPLLYLPARVAARMLALAQIRRVRQAHRGFAEVCDAERLHDLRVALRRLRSLLQAYRAELKGSVRRKDRRRLRALATASAGLRETDVRLAWMAGLPLAGSELAAAKQLRTRDEQSRAETVAAVREQLDEELGRVLRGLRKRLRRYTLELDTKGGPAGPAFAVALGETLTRLRHEFEEQLSRAAKAEDESGIHATRMAAKRLRYAVEPVAGTPAGVAVVAELVAVQDLLGRYLDLGAAAVGIDRELAAAHRAGDEPLVAGLQGLLARARAERTDLLAQLRGAWGEDAARRRVAALDGVVAEVLTAAGDLPATAG